MKNPDNQISILAPARGATLKRAKIQQNVGIFQSSLPRGERHLLIVIFHFIITISILAPARGATKPESCC